MDGCQATETIKPGRSNANKFASPKEPAEDTLKPVLLIAAFVAGACIASSSSANSRFTVDNQVDESVKVRIFNGDDGSCDTSSSPRRSVRENRKASAATETESSVARSKF